MTNHFIDFDTVSSDDIRQLLSLAGDIKANPGAFSHRLSGAVLAMIFEKSSARTRVSFEVGIQKLGGSAISLMPSDIGMGTREPVKDVARVLSRYCDIAMIRVKNHQRISDFAAYSSIPVINGLSDLSHPCQAMADLFTIFSYKPAVAKVAYIGDGNNVCHSLMSICDRLGVDLTVITPPGYEPTLLGTQTVLTTDLKKGLRDADVVYTDVWTSMGQEAEAEVRVRAFLEYQVNNQTLAYANSDAIFMHCLPAVRDQEVTDDVIEGDQSVVFDQAENRMCVQQAIMIWLLEGELT